MFNVCRISVKNRNYSKRIFDDNGFTQHFNVVRNCSFFGLMGVARIRIPRRHILRVRWADEGSGRGLTMIQRPWAEM